VRLCFVVGRHFMLLAALFVQPEPPALALPDHRADSREGVGHDTNQGAVAQTLERLGFNRIEQCALLPP
jgi:hypothetical protein